MALNANGCKVKKRQPSLEPRPARVPSQFRICEFEVKNNNMQMQRTACMHQHMDNPLCTSGCV